MKKEGKKFYVHKMFNAISEKYDFLNHFLSFGMDYYWRFRSIRLLGIKDGHRVLDLASGTGDLAVSALRYRNVQIFAVDIALNMLINAKQKMKKKGLEKSVSFICADGENLPFKNDLFDKAMIAFGIRNMENIGTALNEMYRVLKKTGSVLILEFSLPQNAFFKKIYMTYFKLVLPILGRLVSGHPDAYSYLPDSVENFPAPKKFVQMMENAGFKEITLKKYTFGICTAYIGAK